MDVAPTGDAPHLVTMQIGAFRADQAKRGATAVSVTAHHVTFDAAQLRQQPEAAFQEAKAAVDLSQAERIVAVGRGIKSAENIPMAEQLAQAFGAELEAIYPGWKVVEEQRFDPSGLPESTRKDDPRWYRLQRQ